MPLGAPPCGFVDNEALTTIPQGQQLHQKRSIDVSPQSVILTCQRHYWLSIHPADGRLPGRPALDPLAIAPVLPHVMLIDVEGRPPRFRYRLIGTRMVYALGDDFTGQRLDEAHRKPGSPPPQFPSYVSVAVSGQPEWRRGPPHFASYIDRCKELERIFLPLAANGRTVDMVLTTSLFFDPSGREI